MRLRSECTCHCHRPGVICARHMVACCTPDEVIQELAEALYPDHAPSTALANYKAGREVWDTNGDPW